MPLSKRSDFLNFLFEPRCLKEITGHFGISTSVAAYFLQKAIERGQVLVCKCSADAVLKSSKEQKLRETLFYISQDSDLFSKGLVGFAVTRVAGIQKTTEGKIDFIKFSSKNACKSDFSSMIENSLDPKNQGLRQTSFPRIRVHKEKLVRSPRQHMPVINQPQRQSQIRSFSVAEKLSLFTALSCQQLSYLDIHGRFNISKRMIKTFIRNGLIQEFWGPKNIGVKFRLTKKGEKHLKRLKAAARLGKDKIRKATIQLKYSSL